MIHRDLKPGQVMVGEFGEVLLMDWGLAALYDADLFTITDTPLPGSANIPILPEASNPAGTAAYMAPEQTLKHAEGVGPWTDIYLLGGTLYQLLTGYPPHAARTSQASYYHACEGIVKPVGERAGSREFPAELEEIARRALRTDPADRQPSAMEFVNALQEYLSGNRKRRESIRLCEEAGKLIGEVKSASQERLLRSLAPLDESISQWSGNEEAKRLSGEVHVRLASIRKRRVFKRRIIAGVLLLAFVVSGGWYLFESDRLRKKAETSRDQALRAANVMVLDLARSLRPLAGTKANDVQSILSRANEIFDELSVEQVEDEEVALGRARALESLADIYFTVGLSDVAHDRLVEAVRIQEAWRERKPDSLVWLSVSAHLTRRMGDYYVNDRQYELGMKNHADALQMSEELHKAEPENIDYALLFADHLVGSASSVIGVGNGGHQSSRDYYGEAFAILDDLDHRKIWDRRILMVRARAYGQLGNIAYFGGDADEAIKHFRKRVDAFQQLIEHEPNNTDWISGYIAAMNQLGMALLSTEGPESSSKVLAESAAMGRDLVRMDVENALFKAQLVEALKQYGYVLSVRNNLVEAFEVFDEGLRITEDHLAYDPGNIRFIEHLWFLLGYSGEAELRRDDLMAARTHFQRGVDFAQEQLRLRPTDISWEYRIADAKFSVAKTLDPKVEAERVQALELLQEAEVLAKGLQDKFGLTTQQKFIYNKIDELRAKLIESE